MKILVIGLPRSGKTTYVQNMPGKWLAYDLDYLAAAFRLREPHAERDGSARRMANDLLYGFIDNAERYTENVFIIRAAPSTEELLAIMPDVLVVMRTRYHDDRADDAPMDVKTARTKIDNAIEIARSYGWKVKIITSPPPILEKIGV